MNRTTITKSKNIKSVGYDEPNHKLEIEFHGGGVYEYDDVNSDVVKELMTSRSMGKTFHNLIKNGGYKYSRLK